MSSQRSGMSTMAGSAIPTPILETGPACPSLQVKLNIFIPIVTTHKIYFITHILRAQHGTEWYFVYKQYPETWGCGTPVRSGGKTSAASICPLRSLVFKSDVHQGPKYSNILSIKVLSIQISCPLRSLVFKYLVHQGPSILIS